MKRAHILPIAAMAAIFSLASCSDDSNASTDNGNTQVAAEANTEEADDYVFDTAAAKQITMSGESVSSTDSTVTTSGATATITQAGTYIVSGTLTNGHIVVNADANEKVKIILNNASISSNSGAAIDIENADKVIIDVAASTTNSLSDASGNSQGGAIYSRTKLSIFGTGTLNVDGNNDAAINSQGGVILKDATYSFTAQGTGIDTQRNVIIQSGTLTINAGDEAFVVDEDFTLNNGTINVTTSNEGINAGIVNVNGGSLKITAETTGVTVSGTGANNAAAAINFTAGYVYVNAQSTGFNADGNIKITGGTVITEAQAASGTSVNYSGTFNITGGYFVAVGGTGTADAPSTTSTQNSVNIIFNSVQAANTVVHVQSATGADVTTFRPSGSFKSVIISSAQFSNNSIFTVSAGGTATGVVTNGLYDLISYVGGQLMATFTVTGSVTAVTASGI